MGKIELKATQNGKGGTTTNKEQKRGELNKNKTTKKYIDL